MCCTCWLHGTASFLSSVCNSAVELLDMDSTWRAAVDCQAMIERKIKNATAEDFGRLLRYRQCPLQWFRNPRLRGSAATFGDVPLFKLFTMYQYLHVPTTVHVPTTPPVTTSSRQGLLRMYCRCSARLSPLQMTRDGVGSNVDNLR